MNCSITFSPLFWQPPKEIAERREKILSLSAAPSWRSKSKITSTWSLSRVRCQRLYMPPPPVQVLFLFHARHAHLANLAKRKLQRRAATATPHSTRFCGRDFRQLHFRTRAINVSFSECMRSKPLSRGHCVWHWGFAYLLREFGHIHRLDALEGRESLEPLASLLLHRDDERVLHIAVLRKVQCWNIKRIIHQQR